MHPRTLALLVFVILSNAIGNFALSFGMRNAKPGSVDAYFHPMVLTGVGLLIAWTISRLYLLGTADLSYVLPVTSVGFVLNAWMGAAFLQEHVSVTRWLGVLLICAGAALAGGGKPDTLSNPAA